ncbi:MAG: hypothetical protein M3N45_08560 [Actinomycetota bacterium]|nr:hypothetical protein [Actinomycetota bacterium]
MRLTLDAEPSGVAARGLRERHLGTTGTPVLEWLRVVVTSAGSAPLASQLIVAAKGTSAFGLSSAKKWKVAAVDSLDVESRESCEHHQRKDQQDESSAHEFAADENYGCDT